MAAAIRVLAGERAGRVLLVAVVTSGTAMGIEPLEAARAGDPVALEELLRERRTQVVRYAMRLCISPEDAEDATQEVLLALSRYIGALREVAALSSWLFLAVRTHCTRLARRSLRHALSLDDGDLFVAEHKSQTHLARHPFGVVPVLDDDGFVLFESRAILRYLDARLDGAPLTPRAPKEAARMNQWMSVDQSYIAPHTRTLAVERILKKHEGVAPDLGAERSAEGALGYALGVIDRALGASAHLAGDGFSLADVSLMPYVGSLPMLAAEHLLGGLPRLEAWWERVSARASWKAIGARG